MSIPGEIMAAVNLANETYAAGYKEGYDAGYKAAIDAACAIIKAHPETKEQAERAANTSTPEHQ